MLTPRQRSLCALRDRLDHLLVLMAATSAAAVGFAVMGLLLPVGREGFLLLAGFDLAVTATVGARAAALRRRIAELNFYAP